MSALVFVRMYSVYDENDNESLYALDSMNNIWFFNGSSWDYHSPMPTYQQLSEQKGGSSNG